MNDEIQQLTTRLEMLEDRFPKQVIANTWWVLCAVIGVVTFICGVVAVFSSPILGFGFVTVAALAFGTGLLLTA